MDSHNKKSADEQNWIIAKSDPVLVTGANGFIGSKVAETFAKFGFQQVRCLVRSISGAGNLKNMAQASEGRIILVEGNLLSRESCAEVVNGAKLIVHLAAGVDKSFSGSFLNTVVTTRNLVDAALAGNQLKRFVNVSSFAVYSNWNLPRSGVLDENCPVETDAYIRYESYCYAKVHQDRLLAEYRKTRGLPYVTIRPGAVFGPRSRQNLSPRVGIDTFGIFLHLGGGNRVPLTYVDNCAEAMMLAGLVKGAEGEVFNIVDDDLPTSREFLRMYKQNVGPFRSFWVPYFLFYGFSYLWERYAEWSRWQFPPVFNRRRCATYWQGNGYSNEKAKRLLGWSPRVPFDEAARQHFAYFKSVSASKK
jgi:nucleoside-diphosphate-sugar epimerase